jgi:hypothetical protein
MNIRRNTVKAGLCLVDGLLRVELTFARSLRTYPSTRLGQRECSTVPCSHTNQGRLHFVSNVAAESSESFC